MEILKKEQTQTWTLMADGKAEAVKDNGIKTVNSLENYAILKSSQKQGEIQRKIVKF